ncbi:MAG TPA: DUF6569 family protein [Kofleriaceae bacterium]|nr:DUF6569 family protein [Kofleriaceae bacterium]
MRPAIGLLAIPLFALSVHADSKAPPAPPPPKPDASALSDKAALLPAIQVDSLTLTPIVATAGAQPAVDVIVLDDAFAQKLVKIKEVDSEDVNHLTLTNKADRPLFLLAGEVIIGGKQDRIIGANTLIPAKSTQQVPVFCVEHGRWDERGGSREFTTGKALAHGRLRGNASFEDQGQVWSEVSAKNAARKTTNETDTYRQVAQQQSNGTLAASEKKVDAALAKLPPADRARMIGYVVALNGKVATVDMFSSPTLFGKLEKKLLRSYLTESIDVAAAKSIKPPTPADVKTFMADADKAKAERSYENSASATVRYKGMKAAKARVQIKSPNAAADADAPTVYETYQAK